MVTRKCGWIKDKLDPRDMLYAAHRPGEFALTAPLPAKTDLRMYMPPVYDQLSIGSCTGNGIAACIAYLRYKDAALPDWSPSRLFIYYGERLLEGTVKQDSGAQIRDGIKYVAANGAPPESLWPYVVAKFASKPPKTVYSQAVLHKLITYMRVNWSDLNEVKACLAAGFPIVFGFQVYASMMSQAMAASGLLPMPGPNERCEGGHCVCLCGYDDTKAYPGGVGMGLVRNSWGPGWGQGGYFWMPYPYIDSPSLSDDFWTIRATY